MKLFLALVTILPLSTSCSRAVECAIEGCRGDGNQVLVADDQSVLSEDATVDRDGPQDQKIQDLEDRLTILDKIDGTIDQILTRLTSLEETSSRHEGQISEADRKIQENKDLYDAQQVEIAGLTSQLQALSDKQQTDINDLNSKIDDNQAATDAAIDNLDERFRERVRNLSNRIRNLRGSLRQYKQNARQARRNIRANLRSVRQELRAEVKSLEAADQDIFNTLLNEVDQLEDRVDTNTEMAVRAFLFIQFQITTIEGRLDQLRTDVDANAEEISTLQGELEDLELQLASEAAALSSRLENLENANLINRVVQLESENSTLKNRVRVLENRFNRFVTVQQAFRTGVNLRFLGVHSRITRVQSYLTARIDTQRDRISNIATHLQNIVSRVSTAISGLTNRIDALGTTVSDLDTEIDGEIESLKTDVGELSDGLETLDTMLDRLTALEDRCDFSIEEGQAAPISNFSKKIFVLDCGNDEPILKLKIKVKDETVVAP